MAYSMQTYSVKKWDLGELFPGFDSPELQGAFDNVEEQVASFEGVRGKLKPDMDAETFLDVVRASEETIRIVNRVYAFAGLSFAADTQDQNAQSLVGRVQQFAAEIQNRTLFFNLWWKDVDDSNAERLMNASGDYRYYLEEVRHFKPYTLSEPEEKAINLKDVTGSSALAPTRSFTGSTARMDQSWGRCIRPAPATGIMKILSCGSSAVPCLCVIWPMM